MLEERFDLMALDRGKEFEGMFKEATMKLQAEGYPVDITRLYDVIGKKTLSQPADFICYRYPNEIYVECKSTNDTSFAYFSQPQYPRLIERARMQGVVAGMLVWFVKAKRVFWVDINWMVGYFASNGIKSYTVGRLERAISDGIKGVFEVDQKTVRVNPDMHLESLYNYIAGEISPENRMYVRTDR